MPSFSKSWSGLTPNANICFSYRRSSSNTAISSNTTTSSNGTYSASFNYEYDTEYTWSLYYGHLDVPPGLTTKIDSGTVKTPKPYVTDVSFGFPFYGLRLLEGKSVRLTASVSTYNPGGEYFSPEIEYKTSDPNVATYTSSNNKINAVSIGSSIITASSGGYSDTVNVYVFGISSYWFD